MAQEPTTTTIKMMYSGNLGYISCPADTKYEDILEIAIDRFAIPSDFKNFIQLSNELGYIFKKETFEYFVLLFPNPEIIFYIRVDYSAILGNLRIPLARLRSNKRRHSDDFKAVPVTRQNCFMGSLPGDDTAEEQPKPKRQRTDFIRTRATAVKRTSSKRSIRI